MFQLAKDFTANYSAIESWGYDRFIAPAVVDFLTRLDVDFFELPRAGDRVLDVGCGGGQILRHFADRRTDLMLCGVDLSAEQVGRARKRTSQFGARVEVVQGNALELPFADESFDAVYSVASIKHWPDQQRGLLECARVLKPGGTLLIAEADRGCYLPDAVEFVRRWRMPSLLLPAVLSLFRTYVCGQSVDLDDMRRLAGSLPLSEWEARRIAGTPALALQGIRGQVN